MRKKNTIWKRTATVALSLIMAVGLIPAVSKPLTVEAATTPAVRRFTDKEELMSNAFNLYSTGAAQKVYFGKGGSTGEDSQTWYIAGYDTNAGNLVLMCDPDMPLIKSTPFSYSYPNARFSVDDSQGLSIDTCTYTDGTQVKEVGMNHYGLSKLRAQLKKYEKETEIFSSAEQGLMEETTIYTYDRYNDKYYATTDKLYAPQYINEYGCLVVGKNSELFPNKGLKISYQYWSSTTNPYCEHNYAFWLRTLGAEYAGGNPNRATNYKGSYGFVGCTDSNPSELSYAAVPAFALDVSSVLFASAIPTQTSTSTEIHGTRTTSCAALTFRLDDNNYGKIASTIEYTETGVKVTKKKGDTDILYLCIQGKTTDGSDWFASQMVSGTTEISFTDFYENATKDNCEVWIETTTDNVTYAKMAETVSAPIASVKVGNYTTNQSVKLSTLTEGATIYYTTDGSDPSSADNRLVYNDGDVISVTGKPGETVTTTINAITVTEDGEESRVATYKYVIKLPHVHSWSKSWTSNSSGHWHECTNANCSITNATGKYGYAAHTADSGTITKAPTATTTGVKTYKCSVCGYVMRTEAISATGVKPAAKNTTLTVNSENCKVKVTSTSTTNPTVAYTASTNTKATTIKIPDTVTVDGVVYKVTSIAANAFANNKKITKVTIGKNVTSIGKNAFKNCKKLKTVSLGANVTTINDSAFYKCIVLTKITIPSKVNKIGKQAFYGCKKLKSITIKTTKLTSKKVGSKAFKGIYAKATIKVPSKKLSSYKKMLKAKGVSSKAKIKK